MRTINQNGIDLIKSFEGIRDGDKLTPNYDAYLCPAGYWTIGYGHVVRSGGVMLHGQENESIARRAYPNGLTLLECEQLLQNDLAGYSRAVESLVKVTLTDNQFAALVSLAYNIGEGSFSISTLLKMVNKSDFVGAANQFERWNKGGGKVLAGLTRRRLAEKELFLK